MLHQPYKEDLNFFLPLHFKKRLGGNQVFAQQVHKDFTAPGRHSRGLRCKEERKILCVLLYVVVEEFLRTWNLSLPKDPLCIFTTVNTTP